MTRRPQSPRDAAEAVFQKTAAPPRAADPRPAALPGVKETVSLRIDQEVLHRFQEDGPGWQERINAALRKAVDLA